MDINISSKAGEKLIDTVYEGVGTLANHVLKLDAKKIKRIGEAEAEVEKNKIIKMAEARASESEILNRADKRVLLEQYDKQINIENTVSFAHEELSNETVSDEPVDSDWTRRFLSIAQDTSREDMQRLLAKILAGEVRQPDTFSLRTLNFVHNLTHKELKAFEKLLPYISENKCVYLSCRLTKSFAEFTYNDIMNLIDYGFLKPPLDGVMLFNKSYQQQGKSNNTLGINMTSGNMTFEVMGSKLEQIELPILQLTAAASELVPLLHTNRKIEDLTEYIQEIREFYKSKDLEMIKPNL